ncbi:hypothetical protein K431DRAFT_235896 [Polychaeton citri CBS 116435]|uniref:Uncharacterized protein n=1 Tax=Polychaeton citri CBS 116435 TaxID=1314669 RepID=A0A9P4Q164_9PEZI|nr:hypothetical protein K431DRAFT_235896 [Polychaeton citri CBS 116435]
MERYRILEEQIEKGLAVLMEEAQELRHDLDEGRVKREEFEEKKMRLARDHEIMDTQSLRLRSLMEEDQDFEDDF